MWGTPGHAGDEGILRDGPAPVQTVPGYFTSTVLLFVTVFPARSARTIRRV